MLCVVTGCCLYVVAMAWLLPFSPAYLCFVLFLDVLCCLYVIVMVCGLFPFSPAYLQIPAPQFKVLMDSVVWAFKHTMRNVAEIGLNILLSLLQKFASNEEAGTQFFNTYFLDIMQHIFSVVTDTSHTASESYLSACYLDSLFKCI